MIYRFGDYELDTGRMVLRHGDEPVGIEPQVYDLLRFLLDNRGRLVTKEELLDNVWGDRFVSESALTTQVKAARRAVGDDGRRQEVIRTVHGRGYELVADVTELAPAGDAGGRGVADDPDAASRAPDGGSRLPVELGELIGRETAVAELCDELEVSRMVTLIGPGGVGKTRLALAVCRAVGHRYADGVWSVELVTVVDAASTVEAVATALDVQAQQGRDLADSVVQVLADREGLVLFDNCEHVAGPLADVVDRLLRHAPAISVLATSREPLDVAGEQVWPVDPLPTSADGVEDPAEAIVAPAVRLFVERATAADRRFELDVGNVGAVAEICRRLDGVPLAIELAAARVRALGVSDIADRLTERFRLLRGTRRGADPRHRTLHDTVRWSYDLLEDDERDLFQRLSVFVGPFDLSSAEAVCATDDPADVADVLARLSDRSMVAVRPHGASNAYELFETMREFGRERLDDEQRVGLFQRHAAHHAALAAEVEAGLDTADEADWNATATRAFPDLRAAHRFAVQVDDVDLAMRIVGSAHEYGMRSMRYETLAWADAALGLAGAAGHGRYALVEAVRSYASWVRGEFALSLDQTEAAAARVDDPAALGLIARTRANVLFIVGDEEAGRAACATMVEAAEASGRPSQEAHACYMAAVASSSHGRFDLARDQAERAHAAARRSGSGTDAAGAHFATGAAASAEPDGESALAAFSECDRIATAVGNRWMSAFARTELHGVLLRLGRIAEAAAGHAEVLDTWYRSGDWAQQWLTMSRAISVLVEAGDLDGACRLVGAVETHASIAPVPSMVGLRQATVGAVEGLRADLGEDRFAWLHAEGTTLPVDYVVRGALAALRAAG